MDENDGLTRTVVLVMNVYGFFCFVVGDKGHTLAILGCVDSLSTSVYSDCLPADQFERTCASHTQ